jgi:toxin ParE1/3/4
VKIVWTEPARHDLREIFEYIAEEDPHAARTLLNKIKDHVLLLLNNPQIGQVGRVEGTRELVLAGTHFILPYRLKGRQIQILAVFHDEKRPDSLQN